MYTAGNKHKNGATDKGDEGIRAFFETHVCNELCKALKLLHYIPVTST